MTDRDRLIELYKEATTLHLDYLESIDQKGLTDIEGRAKFTADHLLANGVIVPPCKVGDTVYSLREVSCEDIDEVHTVCEHYGFGTDDRICTLEKPQKCPYKYRVFKCLVTEYNLLSFARVWGKTVFLTPEEAERELEKRKSNGTT